MKDESHLPVAEQSLLFRLRKRAEIRRQIPGRLAVVEGKPDKIANLLDEAADETDGDDLANLLRGMNIKLSDEEEDDLRNEDDEEDEY